MLASVYSEPGSFLNVILALHLQVAVLNFFIKELPNKGTTGKEVSQSRIHCFELVAKNFFITQSFFLFIM